MKDTISNTKDTISKVLKYLKRYNGYKGRHRDPDNRRADSQAALVHWGRHQWNRLAELKDKSYHTPGRISSWSDEPTGLYPIIVGEWI